MVSQQICRDAEQVAPARYFTIRQMGYAQETQIRLLHQVVGQRGIAADARQIGPQRTGRPLVERGERITIHGLRGVRCGNARFQPRNGIVPNHTHTPPFRIARHRASLSLACILFRFARSACIIG